MPSPLFLYKQVAKDFKISDEKNVAPVARMNFAKEQADQMKHIANRLIFDIVTTRLHQEEAKDEASKAAYQQKAAQYENDLRQTSDSLDKTLALIKEFEVDLGQASGSTA